jgi:hypothetical protein
MKALSEAPKSEPQASTQTQRRRIHRKTFAKFTEGLSKDGSEKLFFQPSKSPWQFMFVFSSIDAKGICHLNNKSHAAFEGGKKTKWGGRKTKRKNDLVSREGEKKNEKMKVDVMKRTFRMEKARK